MVVRDSKLKDGVKYWVRPDVENRIAEGAIAAHFNTVAAAFHDQPRGVEVRHSDGRLEILRADAAYVMIGFHPDAELLRRCGVQVDEKTLVPVHNPETCESNVPGLYIAGTVQAGLDTGRIFRPPQAPPKSAPQRPAASDAAPCASPSAPAPPTSPSTAKPGAGRSAPRRPQPPRTHTRAQPASARRLSSAKHQQPGLAPCLAPNAAGNFPAASITIDMTHMS
jgi:hypothetical protein